MQGEWFTNFVFNCWDYGAMGVGPLGGTLGFMKCKCTNSNATTGVEICIGTYDDTYGLETTTSLSTCVCVCII